MTRRRALLVRAQWRHLVTVLRELVDLCFGRYQYFLELEQLLFECILS